MTKGAQVNVRLTERQRTLLELRAAGYHWHAIADVLEEEFDPVIVRQWLDAEDALGANTAEHAIALAIRGGHIL
jgi:hypothetical protein